jgi:hypothetical protein
MKSTLYMLGGYIDFHYWIRTLCRVPGALGKATITLGKSFAECNTRQIPLGKKVSAKLSLPSAQHSTKFETKKFMCYAASEIRTRDLSLACTPIYHCTTLSFVFGFGFGSPRIILNRV